MSIYAAIGVLGFAVYAVSFAGVQLGRLNGNSLHYSAANVVAATLVLVSNIDQFNLPSVLISIFFCSTGVAGIIARRRQPSDAATTAGSAAHDQLDTEDQGGADAERSERSEEREHRAAQLT